MKVTDDIVYAFREAMVNIVGNRVADLFGADQIEELCNAVIDITQTAWISVDDALPPPFHDVLVYRPRTTTAGIPTYEVTNHSCGRFYGNRYPPSHWMLIPEYKGGE